MIKIILADDHPLLLKGLELSIDQSAFEITGTATNGLEALELLKNHEIDIAVLDIEMPELDGIGVVKEAVELNLKTKFVLLTYHKESGLISYALNHPKIFGYLLKEETQQDINSCLELVRKGQKYFSQGLDEILEANSSNQELPTLTPSEKKILKLIAGDFSTEEIAEKLFISQRTVEKHRSNVQNKLKEHFPEVQLKNWISNNRVFISGL